MSRDDGDARAAGVASTHELGVVGGLEALAFGVLVFVVGTLVVLNAWAVVDAKFASSAAAREAVRAVVSAEPGTGPDELSRRASVAAHQAVAAHGYGPDRVTITPGSPMRLERCAEIAIDVRVRVHATLVPGAWSTRSYDVGSSHEDVMDPFRSGLEVDGWDRCGFDGPD